MSGVEKEVKETALNITGKTGDEVVVKGAKNAYAIAKSGGKHSGFYKQLNNVINGDKIPNNSGLKFPKNNR
jgi:hypothetical protein